MKISMAKACVGLNMEDGTRYASKPGGSVEIPDERTDHIAAIKRSPNYTEGHMGKGGINVAFTDLIPDRVCPGCGRRAMFYRDVTTCWKCGSTLPEPVAA